MGDGIGVDFSDFTHLIADIAGAPQKAINNTVGAVEKVSEKVRDDWREPWSGSEHVPGAPPSITYDMKLGAGISAEIGPEIGGPGSLACRTRACRPPDPAPAGSDQPHPR